MRVLVKQTVRIALFYLASLSHHVISDKRARRVHAHAMAAERTKVGITGPELV